MISKTRTTLYPILSVDNIQERDINNSQWDKFQINRPISYYRITNSDIQRPDLISIKIYNSMSYWEVLMRFNNIFDCWNDLIPGEMLSCPHILDIEDWFSVVKNYT
jgi:hypothetical protein